MPRRKSANERTRFDRTEFNRVMKSRRFSQSSVQIARAVLVNGESTAQVALNHDVSRQWVNSLVKRVRDILLENVDVPQGWSVAEVTLPDADWRTVRALERKARQALKNK